MVKEVRNLREYIGKVVSVVYEDGFNHVAKKDGKLKLINEFVLVIEDYKGKEHIIPLGKVIRVECDKGG